MKKALSAILAGVLLLCLGTGCAKNSSDGETVTVEEVSSIVGAGSVGLADWYAGKVVSGETADVKRDSTKAILDTYVEVGDMVQAGDILFAYDTEKMQLDLDKMLLEKEKLENSITNDNATIEELEKQKAKAKEEEQLSYTLQIDEKKADIRENQYNIALSERDIAAMQAALENAEIASPIAGRIMSVEDPESAGGSYYGYDTDDSSGNDVKYITVTDVTRLRVQGNINELNAGALTEGMAMTVRSRLDGTTWTGTLSMIDWENPVGKDNDQNGGMVYVSGSGEDDGMTTATKYPFYVELTDTEGLILGQHVYIEPDTGEDEAEAPKGPMLPGYYLVMEDDGSAYVWAAGDKDKLEKRAVTLGVYDENTDSYEIVDGLSEDDCIAFPAENLEEGMTTEKFDPAAAAAAAEAGDEGAGVASMGG